MYFLQLESQDTMVFVRLVVQITTIAPLTRLEEEICCFLYNNFEMEPK